MASVSSLPGTDPRIPLSVVSMLSRETLDSFEIVFRLF